MSADTAPLLKFANATHRPVTTDTGADRRHVDGERLEGRSEKA